MCTGAAALGGARRQNGAKGEGINGDHQGAHQREGDVEEQSVRPERARRRRIQGWRRSAGEEEDGAAAALWGAGAQFRPGGGAAEDGGAGGKVGGARGAPEQRRPAAVATG